MSEEEIKIIQGDESTPVDTNSDASPEVEAPVQAEEVTTAPVETKTESLNTTDEEGGEDNADNVSLKEARKRIIEMKREKQELRKQESESVDYDALKEQLRQELAEEFQSKLNEGLELKEKVRQLEDEKIYEEFNSELNNNVNDYFTRNPHAKGIVSKDFLLKHYEVNPSLIDLPFDEVVSVIYKDLVSTPRMDGYSNSGKNKPKEIDFSNLSNEDLARIDGDSKLQDSYAKYIQKNL